jgi:hypothetical protein
MTDPSPLGETVVIVHGTFDAPRQDRISWHESDSELKTSEFQASFLFLMVGPRR